MRAHQLGKTHRWRGFPDCVERGLDLGESACRGQQQRAYADDRGKYPGSLMTGALNHGLQDFGTLLPDQPAELADDRALGGIMAKCEPRNRDDDDQQRSDRKNRVVGYCCAAGEVLVLDKSGNSIFNESPCVGDDAVPQPRCPSSGRRA